MIVDLIPDEQQSSTTASAAAAERLPVERLRDATHHGSAAGARHLAGLAALGLFGIAISEADGGLGPAPRRKRWSRGRSAATWSLSVLAQLVAPHLATTMGCAPT